MVMCKACFREKELKRFFFCLGGELGDEENFFERGHVEKFCAEKFEVGMLWHFSIRACVLWNSYLRGCVEKWLRKSQSTFFIWITPGSLTARFPMKIYRAPEERIQSHHFSGVNSLFNFGGGPC